jgi:maltooligosyltrehalose trehalohydrolase
VKAFRVWAPNAGRVDLVLPAGATPMQSEPDGWWQAEVATAGEVDYAFSLDGGPALPDPRSPCQPAGVHGRSRTVDHAAFGWQQDTWRVVPLREALIYELHVGTFTPAGSFEAAIDRLEHLVALGVTHVELMPVASFPGARGWGYDGVDLYAPQEAYGGPDGLKRLVDAAHARGLAVLLDVVYNHLGPDGNYLEVFGPYFTKRFATPWGKAVNLDGAGSHEVRSFLIDNALMWLRDYRIDGLRIDAVHAIFDMSAVHFLEELAIAVEALVAETGRELVLVAESDLNDPRLLWSRDRGGYGLHAAWSDDFHHALHAVLTGEDAGYYADFGSLADLAKALREAYVYDGRFSRNRNRSHGRTAIGLEADRFVVATQNHDQVGNRARGERLVQLAGLRKAKIAAAVLLLSPFVPMLFQGEEWAASTPFLYFTDHADPRLGAAVTEGRRREFASFGWDPENVPDPQAVSTFEASKLDWSELEREPYAEMLAWYRDLIALRGSYPGLRDHSPAGLRVEWDEGACWLRLGRGAVELCVNFSATARRLPASGRVILASDPAATFDGPELSVPPESAVVLLTTDATAQLESNPIA